MIQKNYLFIYAGMALLLVAMIVIVVIGRSTVTETRSMAAPATVLAIEPATISPKQGDEFSVTVSLDTGGNVVSMVAPHIIFDPQKLTFLGFTRSNQFPQLVSDVSVNKETISLSVSPKSLADTITGRAVVGEFKFKVIDTATGPTMITFADSAYAGLVGPGAVNTLTQKLPSTIDIPKVIPDPPTSDQCRLHIPLATKK
jgi:hypothetical protein